MFVCTEYAQPGFPISDDNLFYLLWYKKGIFHMRILSTVFWRKRRGQNIPSCACWLSNTCILK